MGNGNRNLSGDGFSLKARIKSFSHAFRGIANLIRGEHNFRIHLFVLAIVVGAGLLLKIPAGDWLVVVLAAGLVLASESFNTAIELLSDKITPESDPEIRKIKDIAAAGVLIAALAAVVAGLVIFIPAIVRLFVN